MTLIVTAFNRFGIINASDSNVYSRAHGTVAEGKKTFEIPGLRAGLTIAGTRSIGGIQIADYINSALQSHNQATLGNFARELYDQLRVDLLPDELQRFVLIQIGGFSKHNDGWRPELWFIRNASINSATGDYELLPDLAITEDFWSDYCLGGQLMGQFNKGESALFFNGFPAGRMGFRALVLDLDKFYNAMWSNPAWQFRAPTNLEESELLVTNYMRTISALFRMSDYGVEYIGGPIQTHLVHAPGQLASQSGAVSKP